MLEDSGIGGMNMGVEEGIKYLLWYKDPVQFFRDIFNLDPFVYQEQVLRDLTDFSKDKMLIMGAGGIGKTKLLACICLWYSTVLPRYLELENRHQPVEVLIISASKSQSLYLYDYVKSALEDTPELSVLVEEEPRVSYTRFKDRSIIRALPNSYKAIQGKHGDLVIVDEASQAGNFIIMDTWRMIKPSDYSRIILSSTPFDPGKEARNLFIEMYLDEKRYSDWVRYHFSAKDCPLKRDFEEEAKAMGDYYYDVFYLGKPHPRESGMIDLDLLREASENIPKFKVDPASSRPVMGIDWGFARSATGITIVQKVDDVFRVLYSEQFKGSTPEALSDTIKSLAEAYNVVRIYCDAENKSENMRLKSLGLPVIPRSFRSHKTRWQINLRSLFESRRILIPEEFIDLKLQLMRYDWNTKGNDDLVDSLMLALLEDTRSASSESILVYSSKFRSTRFRKFF